MKKLYACCTVLFTAVVLQAAPIDSPAASVHLIKTELVTREQLQTRTYEIEQLRIQSGLPTGPQTKEQVLDAMIAEILLKQAAERENISVSQAELSRLLAEQKKGIEQQLRAAGQLQEGAILTDTRFRELITQTTGLSYDDFMGELEFQLLQQKFISQTKREMFERISDPSEQEIEEQYILYQDKFTNPKMVRFQQIFFSTINLDAAEKAKALERAEEAYRKLKQGEAFDALVSQYTDDPKGRYNGGDYGYLPVTDERARAYFGAGFFNALFKLDQGDISTVLSSNMGYHIVRITEKRDPAFLGLDDPMSPTNPTTVRQFITAGIMQKKQQDALQKAFSEVITELTEEATIRKF
ncbi:MAG: peptidylprolyl isomerase [Spirochaetales bacterium]|nr:peptidylprolyl isomerase [Spirochaetales bacterium]